jgi:hypothetical protein
MVKGCSELGRTPQGRVQIPSPLLPEMPGPAWDFCVDESGLKCMTTPPRASNEFSTRRRLTSCRLVAMAGPT